MGIGGDRLARLLGPLSLDFSYLRNGRETTQTFSILLSCTLVFLLAVLVWAAGAGVMRTVWLVRSDAGLSPHSGLSGTAAIGFAQIGVAVLLLLWEAVRAAGGVLLLCSAAALIGGFLGFLFGLPRPPAAQAATPPGTDAAPRRQPWQTASHLPEISDWLTKIIVGVSLVEAQNAWTAFGKVSLQAADWLFQQRHGSPAVIPAALIASAVFGFLFLYLYTDLVLARLIADTDEQLATLPDARETRALAQLKGFDEALVPRISRSAHPDEPSAKPTVAQVAAALQYRAVALGELTAFADILNWSRARALLDNYAAAAEGYVRLLGMPDDPAIIGMPALLSEAARALNAGGETVSAALLIETGVDQIAKAEPGVQAAILGDAAALCLSGRIPGGYEGALRLLNGPDAAKLYDSNKRLHLLRALANGQKYRAEQGKMEQAARDSLKDAILQDLRAAFADAPQIRDANLRFLTGAAAEDLDLGAFKDDPAFRAVFGLPDQGS